MRIKLVYGRIKTISIIAFLMRACMHVNKKRRTQSLEKREVMARCVLSAWANYVPKKGGNCRWR